MRTTLGKVRKSATVPGFEALLLVRGHFASKTTFGELFLIEDCKSSSFCNALAVKFDVVV